MPTSAAQHANLSDWIKGALLEKGLPATGTVAVAYERTWATTLKVTTTAGIYWCKANGPGFRGEANVVEFLADHVSARVPALLAVDTENGWILSEDAGKSLEATLDLDPDMRYWESAISEYAHLQRELEPHATSLEKMGVINLAPSELPGRYEEILTTCKPHLLGLKGGLSGEEYHRLESLRNELHRWCQTLHDIGVPLSLQHDDLTDDNIFLAGSAVRFLDWADASVAHPFASLIYPERLAIRRFKSGPGGIEVRRLRDAYLEPWTKAFSRSSLDEARTLACRLAPVGRALAWHRALEGVSRHNLDEYHASAEARWMRQLLATDTY